jgi:FkbM family methyltransferase
MIGNIRVRIRAMRRQAQIVQSHPSNRGFRLRIWAKVAQYEVNSLWRRPTVVPFADGLMVEASKGGNSSARAVFARLPDWPEMVIWREWLRKGDAFLDVGSNVGLYALLAAGQGCAVTAVEPAADMAERLRRNLELNSFADVTVREVAVMDRPGMVNLVGPDPNRRSATTSEVGSLVATTVDELVGDGNLRGMKIDVEGNERLVLEGASRLLGDGRVDLIQLEWNTTSETALGEDRAPLAAILRCAGFELFQVKGRTLIGPFDALAGPSTGGDVFAARGAAIEFLSSRRWDPSLGRV